MPRQKCTQSRADLHTWSAIAILHCGDAVMQTDTDARTECTLPEITTKRRQTATRKRPIQAQRLVLCSVLKAFWLADDTHHPGAACRLLSVPKAHTFARLLCRKTSPFSGVYDGTRCCFSQTLERTGCSGRVRETCEGAEHRPVLYCAI